MPERRIPMVQRSAETAEAAVRDELIKTIKEFVDEVQELADYTVRTSEESPERDYMEYLRKTKVGKSRNRRK